ncbi:putative pheromone response protein [Aspergillus steynii IBT 23096]|uniref:Putative pheromone response protein n=1 Tax=Aspergillus steynii IBT 23096 TaxID=1392250 RepID=A0A2I2GGL5_9EURO|nr:putative pheromone response protein [Aspergillus steynii IBT 23096]PLB52016.1 putative pheromone response protein [Aspergillus steynii IBT 23096]
MPAKRASLRKKRAPSVQPAPQPSTKASTIGRKRKAAAGAAPASETPARGPKRQKGMISSAFAQVRRLTNVGTATSTIFNVCGTNCYGELGLGNLWRKSEFARPILNANLAAETVGVVQLAVGGIHSAALTHDNKILTWGVNDDATLGRDTKEDPVKDEMMIDAKNEKDSNSDSDSDDDLTLNLKEATPMAIDPSLFPKGTTFAQLSATDSATFALTTTGLVYGWGTFRNNNGDIGFSPNNKFKQITPLLIPGLNNVTKLAAGAQHMLALTSAGSVYGWGCNEQQQLGRRRTCRSRDVHPLLPDQCALPGNIVDIGAGMYHSFAIQRTGAVYGWGSNNFGQIGIADNAGENDAIINYPTRIKSIAKKPKLVQIHGGKDHSITVDQNGQCLTWGRIENKALGYDPQILSEDEIIFDSRDRPRISAQPHAIPTLNNIVYATAGTDHSFAISADGNAYSWGFNAQCQAGKPSSTDEIILPTLLDGKHITGKKLVSASAGGQFSVIVGEHASQ